MFCGAVYLENRSSKFSAVVMTMIFSPVFVLTSECVLITSISTTSWMSPIKYSLDFSNRTVRTFLSNSTPWLFSASFCSDWLRKPLSRMMIRSWMIRVRICFGPLPMYSISNLLTASLIFASACPFVTISPRISLNHIHSSASRRNFNRTVRTIRIAMLCFIWKKRSLSIIGTWCVSLGQIGYFSTWHTNRQPAHPILQRQIPGWLPEHKLFRVSGGLQNRSNAQAKGQQRVSSASHYLLPKRVIL